MQEIEGHVGESTARVFSGRRVLERLEAGRAVGQEDGHLAVQHRRPDGQARHALGHGGKLRRPVALVPAHQPHLPILETGEDAVAVELQLVQPLLARRRLGGDRRKLGRDELRQAATPRSRLVLGGEHRPVFLAAAALRMPDAIPRRGDLLHAPPGRDAFRAGLGDAELLRRPRLGVAVLDQQPALPRVPSLPLVIDPDERPAPLQLLAVERELEAAGVIALVRVFLRLPRPAVPQEHRAPAVLALGDDALE